jgi:hypothetical protein
VRLDAIVCSCSAPDKPHVDLLTVIVQRAAHDAPR